MTYAKVVNGEIVEYNRTLPFSTETTSFGVGTDAETLKSFGYLPIIGSEPEYDRATHRIGNVTYAVGDNEVVKSYEVIALTPEEIRERDVPKQITPRQIRQQLTVIGLRQTVEDLISSSTDYNLKDWWEYSQDFQRSHPILQEVGIKLGMSESDMDTFFIEASKIISGSVVITDTQLHNSSILSQIATIERQILTIIADTYSIDPAISQPATIQLKEYNDQITSLRSQLL